MAIGDPLRRALRRFSRRSLESGTPGVEGQPKPGPWLITTGEQQGWLPAEWGFLNHFQMDLDPLPPGTSSAIVEACVAAYAQTIAMCPGDHWRALANGGRERVTTSALSRILRKPNDYQSRSDFLLKLAADLYRDGNTYALAQRNDRFEVSALHPFDPKQSHPIVAPSGEIFYELIGNDVVERQFGGGSSQLFGLTRSNTGIIAPARDVLHVKLEPKAAEPLIGVPPARHAASAIAAQRAIGSQLINTFGNMSRPAGVIESDVAVTAAQTSGFRKSFMDVWRGIDNLNGAGPPILPPGMKFKGVSMTAQEADVAAAIKLTQEQIWMVFGVPPAILGITDKSSFASTEALMQFWLARGLGFAINHIEVAFDHFFGLASWPTDWVEFDTAALLRVQYKDRIEALARGVQGGIYAPNEARRAEELPAAPFGDEPRVQQQVVPLSAWDKAKPETPRPDAPPAPPPAREAETETEEEPPTKEFLMTEIRRRVEALHAA